LTWAAQVLSVQVRAQPPPYNVSFGEKGLPDGTHWGVTVGGANDPTGTVVNGTSVISFALRNGTYRYSILPVLGYWTQTSGTVLVDGGNISILVAFHPGTAVTFTETGLPTGTTWSVTLIGSTENSSTSAIAFTEPNGTYPFRLGIVPGWTTPTFNGSVTVNGTNVTRTFAWTQVTYTVTFVETGLPSNTNWSITMNGVMEHGVGNLTFPAIPNGTYTFTVGSVSGYTVSSSARSVVVNGVSLSMTVAFAKSSSATFLGLSVTAGYAVLGLIILVILLAIILVVIMRRRRKTPPNEAMPSTPPGTGMPPPVTPPPPPPP
jgi:hypothetical protein